MIGTFQKKKLKKAIEYLSAGGVVDELVLTFNKETQQISTSWLDNDSKSVSAITYVKIPEIEESCEITLISLSDPKLTNLTNVLGAFHDEDKIKMEVLNSFLVLSSGSTNVKIRLGDKNHIKSFHIPKYEFKDNVITFKNGKKLEKYARLNVDYIKDAIKNSKVIFATKFGMMINEQIIHIVSQNDGGETTKTSAPLIEGKGKCEGIFSTNIIEKGLSPLFGNLSIFMEDNEPMVIQQKNDEVDLMYSFGNVRD